jgi:uncharacterized protein YgfB (UPF0149 family)
MSPGDEWFQVLARALESAGSPIGPAEFHGGLCGVLCVGGPEAVAAWLGRCAGELGSPRFAEAEFRELCAGLQSASWTALAGSEMTFTPLSPNDDTSLSERVGALAAWCSGFVSGLGQGGADFQGALGESAEVTEIVGDLIEIGKAGLDTEAAGDDEEGAEAAYAQIMEFVRVGVQVLFEELGQTLRPRGASIH